MSSLESLSVRPDVTALEGRRIHKSFGASEVLVGVDISLNRGEIHGLVGENGAGKSTLCKILAGIYTRSSGEILVDGRQVLLADPAQAIEEGIALVQQDPQLVPTLTVAQNIFLGRRRGQIASDRASVLRKAAELLDLLGADLDPASLAEELSPADRQLVEICKGVAGSASAIIFDEPTSALSHREEERLHNLIRTLKGNGVALLYISHILDDVFSLCDLVTVLRDGKRISTHAVSEVTREEIIQQMIGRELELNSGRRRSSTVASFRAALVVEDLELERASSAVTFNVGVGELVGLYGLTGSGRGALLKALFGLHRWVRGNVSVRGKAMKGGSTREAIDRGLALVPGNRRRDGLMLSLSTERNLSICNLAELCTIPWIVNRAREKQLAAAQIERFDIRPKDAKATVATLSGGNQQKVVLARWLRRAPNVLLVDEPTAGVDIGAKEEVYKHIDSLVQGGASVLLSSSDPRELVRLCDRVLIMRAGAITAELTGDALNQRNLIDLADRGRTP